MGKINAAWRVAMATLGQNFTKAEKDAGWPETLEHGQLAALQYPNFKVAKARAADIVSACDSGDLLHTVTTKTVMTKAARNVTPSKFSVKDWSPAHTLGGVAYAYTIPAQYKDVTTYNVTAPDFAAWLAAQPETPSEHIAAWFEAVGVNTQPQPEAATVPPPPVTPEKKPRKKRDSWKDELPYIAKIYLSTQQTKVIGLWRELKAKAGIEDSPFIVGKGIDRDKLVVKKTGATLMEHTLATNMSKVREQATKSN